MLMRLMSVVAVSGILAFGGGGAARAEASPELISDADLSGMIAASAYEFADGGHGPICACFEMANPPTNVEIINIGGDAPVTAQVPEPAALGLLGAGALSLLVLRRRKA